MSTRATPHGARSAAKLTAVRNRIGNTMNQLSGMDIHQVRQTANLFSVVADEIDEEDAA